MLSFGPDAVATIDFYALAADQAGPRLGDYQSRLWLHEQQWWVFHTDNHSWDAPSGGYPHAGFVRFFAGAHLIIRTLQFDFTLRWGLTASHSQVSEGEEILRLHTPHIRSRDRSLRADH